MANKRIYIIARENGLTSKDIMQQLRQMGIEVKTQMKSLDEETTATVLAALKGKVKKETKPAPAAKKPEKEVKSAAKSKTPAKTRKKATPVAADKKKASPPAKKTAAPGAKEKAAPDKKPEKRSKVKPAAKPPTPEVGAQRPAARDLPARTAGKPRQAPPMERRPPKPARGPARRPSQPPAGGVAHHRHGQQRPGAPSGRGEGFQTRTRPGMKPGRPGAKRKRFRDKKRRRLSPQEMTPLKRNPKL